MGVFLNEMSARRLAKQIMPRSSEEEWELRRYLVATCFDIEPRPWNCPKRCVAYSDVPSQSPSYLSSEELLNPSKHRCSVCVCRLRTSSGAGQTPVGAM